MNKKMKTKIIPVMLLFSANTFVNANAAEMNIGGVTLEHDFPVSKKIRQDNKMRNKWPCISYEEKCGKISARKVQKYTLEGELNGNPKRGKMIALKKGKNKGNCIACHKLKDGIQHGTVGPDLSKYGLWERTDAQTYALVNDMRNRSAFTMMPPFGTNKILNDQAIRDVVAYLQSSK